MVLPVKFHKAAWTITQVRRFSRAFVVLVRCGILR
jgi:hypothetical protein